MENSSLPLLPFRSKELANQPARQNSGSFFDTHPVAELARSLFLSSLLWVFLAFTVYTVYTMIAGAARP